MFSGIESFSVDLDDGFGCLHVTDDDYNDFHYDNVLSRSIKSVKKEMKKDRDRARQSYSKARSGGTGLIDYLHAATNVRCTHCDQPTEGGPYPGDLLVRDLVVLCFDSYGNTI